MASETESADINVSEARAFVAWKDGDGKNKAWPHVDLATRMSCSIRLQASTNKAFFKLRFPVQLEDCPVGKPSVYLHIYPERILSLAATKEHAPSTVRALLSAHMGLQFELKQPAIVVVPPKPLAPKNTTSAAALDALQSLAPTTSFALYMPAHTLSETLVASLCQAVTAGGLQTLASSADVSRLYAGLGGTAVEGRDFTLAAANERVEAGSPPSYDELGLTPPPQEPPKKRRRGNAGAVVKKQQPEKLLADDKEQLVQEISKRVIEGIGITFRAQLKEMKAEILDEVDKRIDHRLEQYDEEQKEYVREELWVQEQDVLNETTTMVDDKLDDLITGVKDDMTRYVRDEIGDAEDRIKANVESYGVTLSFNGHYPF